MTIDTDDIEALLGRNLTTAENVCVDRLIELAEGAVEDVLPGFSIATGTETVDVAGDDPDTLWTPRYPLSDLTELTVDSVTVDPVYYRTTVKGRIDLGSWPAPWTGNAPEQPPWWGSTISVTYDFGLDPPPPAIVNAVASMVANLLRSQASNSNGAMSYSIGSYAESHGAAAQAALAAGMVVPDSVGLRRWSRTRQVSVPLTRAR